MASRTGRKTSATTPLLTRPAPARESPAWLRGLYAVFFLYLFLCSINVMGSGLKTLDIDRFLRAGGDPVIALMGGVVATAIVQSSSIVTALIIAFVAAGQMNLDMAIFAVMGANVGTSITNNLASLATWRIRRQFRRAYTAAMMHGFVNLLTVAVLFPLELATGLLTRVSMQLAGLLGLDPIENPHSPVKMMTRPVVSLFEWLGGLVTTTDKAQGVVMALAGLILLIGSLVMLVTNLKGALLRRIERLFSSFLFRSELMAGVVGGISTIMVQSSSVTTSLIVPLVGAGAIKLRRAFPFMLGCNIGTTVTAVIAATANPMAAAVGVAICHVFFNVIAVAIWYPMRFVPIGLATWYGRLAARSKWYYVAFLLVVYFAIPGLGYLISSLLGE